uniref:MYND-type domain-containing protein n=1 Tax=Hyaloperonospora arabidopsidis (strain Emoy2) TaxID=559515 RepID=M4B699_HYAAE
MAFTSPAAHRRDTSVQTAALLYVREAQVARRCHWCFLRLCKKAVQCADCTFARYCSRGCLAADASLHDFQCRALRALKCGNNGDGIVGDVETVRLTLAVLSMEQFVRNPHALKQLLVHCAEESSSARDEARNAVEFIVKKTGRVLDRKHVWTTLERVRCNAHPLYVDGVTCVGSGVFPDAAMALNHSCLPNVVPSFDPRTRTLAFHAIADIPPKHAVECAYIDLLQTRKRRQALLSQGFGFACVCLRCTNERGLASTDGQDVAVENEQESQTEMRVMEELMQLTHSSHAGAVQRLSRLKRECADIFQHNCEAQFALYTAELQLARVGCDWKRVVDAAETLLTIWTRCGLPKNYHTTETLYMQIYCAARRAGMMDKEKASALQVSRIRQICGYMHPETLVG